MERNLETECKVLLNSDDYKKIYDYFNLNESMVIKQVNYYFDTSDMNLVKNKFNMRVRHVLKTDEYIFTVKIPTVGEANIEINQEITYDEFKDLIENNKLPEGFIKEKVEEFNSKPIILLASLATERFEFEYENGLIALDYNTYNNRYDYELEYEGKDIETCKFVIGRLLTRLDIEYVFNKVSKRKRAISTRV